MDVNQLINYVKLDDAKRILVSLKPQFETYLQNDKNKQMIKKACMDVLKDEFVKLEVGKNMCRITVKAGTEEKNLEKVKKELIKGLEFAMRFMGKM